MDAFLAAADRHFNQTVRLDRNNELGGTCLNGAACCFCLQLVSFALEVPLRDLCGPNRGVADVALARQVAMYLAHTKLSISQVEVGLHFKRDKSTVTHACQLVEAKRDEEPFEHLVSQLETMLDAMEMVSGQVGNRLAAQYGRSATEGARP